MEKEFKYQNKKIFYRTFGSGGPVVLIHGFGEDGEVWKNQVDFLKDKYYIIVPDLPGTGKSEMIEDMSMEGMAEAIKFILDSEFSNPATPEEFRVTLIGHSMGGYITLAFAKKYHRYLNGFGLFHSSAYPDDEEKKAIREKGIQFIKHHGPFAFLKTIIPNFFSPVTKKKNPDLITGHINKQTGFSTDPLIAYYKGMKHRYDHTDLLKIVKIPILFILGVYDNAVPLDDGLKQCQLPEKSYIHVLKNSGHMGMLEEADKANRILEDYLLQTRN